MTDGEARPQDTRDPGARSAPGGRPCPAAPQRPQGAGRRAAPRSPPAGPRTPSPRQRSARRPRNRTRLPLSRRRARRVRRETGPRASATGAGSERRRDLPGPARHAGTGGGQERRAERGRGAPPPGSARAPPEPLGAPRPRGPPAPPQTSAASPRLRARRPHCACARARRLKGPRPPSGGPDPRAAGLGLSWADRGRSTDSRAPRSEERHVPCALRGCGGQRAAEGRSLTSAPRREPRPLGERAEQGPLLFRRRSREGPAGEKK